MRRDLANEQRELDRASDEWIGGEFLEVTPSLVHASPFLLDGIQCISWFCHSEFSKCFQFPKHIKCNAQKHALFHLLGFLHLCSILGKGLP